MATYSSILPWKTPWTEEPGKLYSIGLQRVGHDWAHSNAQTNPERNSERSSLNRKEIRIYWKGNSPIKRQNIKILVKVIITTAKSKSVVLIIQHKVKHKHVKLGIKITKCGERERKNPGLLECVWIYMIIKQADIVMDQQTWTSWQPIKTCNGFIHTHIHTHRETGLCIL